jgi:hypothetical protein
MEIKRFQRVVIPHDGAEAAEVIATVWVREPTDTQLGAWGGDLYPERDILLTIEPGEYRLHLASGVEGEIIINKVRVRSSTVRRSLTSNATFSGNGEAPF